MDSYSNPCIANCYACKNYEKSLFIELEYLSEEISRPCDEL